MSRAPVTSSGQPSAAQHLVHQQVHAALLPRELVLAVVPGGDSSSSTDETGALVWPQPQTFSIALPQTIVYGAKDHEQLMVRSALDFVEGEGAGAKPKKLGDHPALDVLRTLLFKAPEFPRHLAPTLNKLSNPDKQPMPATDAVAEEGESGNASSNGGLNAAAAPRNLPACANRFKAFKPSGGSQQEHLRGLEWAYVLTCSHSTPEGWRCNAAAAVGKSIGRTDQLECRFVGGCRHAPSSKAGQMSSLTRDFVQFQRRNMEQGLQTTQAAARHAFGNAAAVAGTTAMVPSSQTTERMQVKRSRDARSGRSSVSRTNDPFLTSLGSLRHHAEAIVQEAAAKGEPVNGYLQMLNINPDFLAVSFASGQLRIAHHLCCAGREHSLPLQSDSTGGLVSDIDGKAALVTRQVVASPRSAVPGMQRQDRRRPLTVCEVVHTGRDASVYAQAGGVLARALRRLPGSPSSCVAAIMTDHDLAEIDGLLQGLCGVTLAQFRMNAMQELEQLMVGLQTMRKELEQAGEQVPSLGEGWEAVGRLIVLYERHHSGFMGLNPVTLERVGQASMPPGAVCLQPLLEGTTIPLACKAHCERRARLYPCHTPALRDNLSAAAQRRLGHALSVMLVRTPHSPSFHGPHCVSKLQTYFENVVDLLSRRYLSLGLQCGGLVSVRRANPADVAKREKAQFVMTLLQCPNKFGELFQMTICEDGMVVENEPTEAEEALDYTAVPVEASSDEVEVAPIEEKPVFVVPNPLFVVTVGKSGKPTARLAGYAQQWGADLLLNCSMVFLPLFPKLYACSQQVWGTDMATQQTTSALEGDWCLEKHHDRAVAGKQNFAAFIIGSYERQQDKTASYTIDAMHEGAGAVIKRVFSTLAPQLAGTLQRLTCCALRAADCSEELSTRAEPHFDWLKRQTAKQLAELAIAAAGGLDAAVDTLRAIAAKQSGEAALRFWALVEPSAKAAAVAAATAVAAAAPAATTGLARRPWKAAPPVAPADSLPAAASDAKPEAQSVWSKGPPSSLPRTLLRADSQASVSVPRNAAAPQQATASLRVGQKINCQNCTSGRASKTCQSCIRCCGNPACPMTTHRDAQLQRQREQQRQQQQQQQVVAQALVAGAAILPQHINPWGIGAQAAAAHPLSHPLPDLRGSGVFGSSEPSQTALPAMFANLPAARLGGSWSDVQPGGTLAGGAVSAGTLHAGTAHMASLDLLLAGMPMSLAQFPPMPLPAPGQGSTAGGDSGGIGDFVPFTSRSRPGSACSDGPKRMSACCAGSRPGSAMSTASSACGTPCGRGAMIWSPPQAPLKLRLPPAM